MTSQWGSIFFLLVHSFFVPFHTCVISLSGKEWKKKIRFQWPLGVRSSGHLAAGVVPPDELHHIWSSISLVVLGDLYKSGWPNPHLSSKRQLTSLICYTFLSVEVYTYSTPTATPARPVLLTLDLVLPFHCSLFLHLISLLVVIYVYGASLIRSVMVLFLWLVSLHRISVSLHLTCWFRPYSGLFFFFLLSSS